MEGLDIPLFNKIIAESMSFIHSYSQQLISYKLVCRQWNNSININTVLNNQHNLDPTTLFYDMILLKDWRIIEVLIKKYEIDVKRTRFEHDKYTRINSGFKKLYNMFTEKDALGKYRKNAFLNCSVGAKMPYMLFINCINILYRHNDLDRDTIWNSIYEYETELIYRHISYLYFSVLFKIDLDFDEISLTDLCNIVLNLNLRDEYKEELSVYLSNKYKDLNTSNDYEGLFDEEYITNDDKNKLILLTLDKLTSGSLSNHF